MGYAERSYSFRFGEGGFGGDGGGRAFGSGLTPWVKRLLIANTAIFLFNVVGLLPHGWTVRHLGFDPGAVLTHPWSPVTYMFVHGGFWHLFVNMLILFFFGPPLERKWGQDYFIRFYVVSGLGGALFSVLLVPVVGSSIVVGASGALYGLLLAFALNWPEAPIYIWGLLPVKAKWFVGVLAVMALFGTMSGSNSGVASWAHLGGLVTGFAYLRGGDRIEKWIAGLRGGKRQRRGRGRRSGRRSPGSTRRTVRLGGDGGSARKRAEETWKGRSPGDGDGDDLDRVNRILDKIREEGIDSLTTSEREFLDEMSRRYREPE